MSTLFISGKDLFMYMGEKRTLILDIRNNELYQEGHICGAVNCYYNDNYDEFCQLVEEYINSGKYDNIIIYCEHGGTSYSVADFFSEHENIRILLLYGGIKAYRGKLCRG